MRRAPFVITGTLVGLAGVLSFRSAPAALSAGTVGTAAPTTTSLPAAATTTTVAGASPPASGATTPTTVRSTPTTVHVATTTVAPTTTVASGTRSATGAVVNYFFGTVSVKVTATGSKITAVSIASLNDGGNPRSVYIDQQALPMLIQQVMAAQSSQIQGVSGATYTSEGFYTSLLGALKSLGLK
ncbi:MAG: FMN-binding protein [Acidobacteriota bacterium]|nr:FMN-binding protein [Acidobacteriota bacterium]